MRFYDSILSTLRTHIPQRPNDQLEQLATQITRQLGAQAELSTLSERLILDKLSPVVQIMLAQEYSTIEQAAQYAVNLIVTQVTEDPHSIVPAQFHSPQDCPYPGLLAFDECDHDRFCGRNDDLQRALAAADQAIIPITGPSGIGKSSFARAGLIPALRRHWGSTTVCLTHPFNADSNLLVGLVQTLCPEPSSEHESLIEALRNDPQTLIHLLTRQQPDSGHIYLLIDQFEAIFIDDEKSHADDRRHVLDALLAVDASGVPGIHIILTTRENYFEHPDYIARPQLATIIQRRNLPLDALDNHQLRIAIEEPLHRFNQQYAQDVRFQDGLVDLIIQTFRRTSVGSLPLMQYLLRLLWTEKYHLTHFAYNQIGGLERVLDRHATETFQNIPEQDQPLAKNVLVALVRPGIADEYARKRVRREDLRVERDSQRLPSVLQKLMDTRSRLLTEHRQGDTVYIELTHEILLHQWSFLRELIDARKERIRLRETLLPTADLWQQSLITHGSLGDASYFYTKSVLKAAQKYVEDTSFVDDVDTRIATCYAASQKYQRNQRVRLVALSSGVVIFMLIVSIWAIFRVSSEQTRTQSARQTAAANATGQAIAEIQRVTAAAVAGEEQQRAQAENNRRLSLNLAQNAQAAFQQGNRELALNLALEATSFDSPPPLAQYTLANAAYAPGPLRRFTAIYAVVAHDRQTAIIETQDGTIHLLNLDSGTIKHSFPGITSTSEQRGQVPDSVALSADGSSLLVATSERLVVIDIASGNVTRSYDLRVDIHNNALGTVRHEAVRCVQLSDDGAQFLVTDGLGATTIRQTSDGHVLLSLDQAQASFADTPHCAIFSPDGTKLLIGSVLPAPFSTAVFEGTLILVDAQNGKELLRFDDYAGNPGLDGVTFDAGGMAFSPDGTYFAYAALDNTVRLQHIDTGEDTARLNGSRAPVIFSPDGKHLISHVAANGASEAALMIWDIKDAPKKLRSFSTNTHAISFSSKGQRVYTFGDSQLTEWSLSDAAQLQGDVFGADLWESGADSAVFRQDGKTALLLISGFDAGPSLYWFNMATGEQKELLETGVTSIKARPDGQTALILTSPWTLQPTSSDPGSIPKDVPLSLHIVDIATGAIVTSFGPAFEHSNDQPTVTGVFSTDTKRALISVSRSTGQGTKKTTLSIWDVDDQVEVQPLATVDEAVQDLQFSDDATIAMASISVSAADGEKNQIILWDVATGHEIKRLQTDTLYGSVILSPNKQYIAAGGYETGIALYAVAGEVKLADVPLKDVNYVLFSPDSKTLLIQDFANTLTIWSMTDQKNICSLAEAGSTYDFSADGSLLLTAANSVVHVWDRASCQELRQIDTYDDIHVARFTPDEHALMTGGAHGVKVWRYDSLDELRQYVHTNFTLPALSPEQRTQYELKPSPTPIT